VGYFVVILYFGILVVLLLQLRQNYGDAAKRVFTIGYTIVYVALLPFALAQFWHEWPYSIGILIVSVVGYFVSLSEVRF